MDRKKIILFVLLILLIVSVGYRIRHPFEQRRVSRLKYTNKGVAASSREQPNLKGKKPGARGEESSLTYMKLCFNPAKHSRAVIRDLFFEKKAEVKKAPQKQPVAQEQRPKQVRPAQDPVQKVMEELSQFRVFGSFESNGDTVLFLERGRDILVVRKGDWIDGKFQLKDISDDSITLWASEAGQEVHIALDN
ncbi:MAG: hypothetical protein DRH12_13115 [Deltaproteobacteria bacterium]|nr:MAG: hypothetical protein DRH12_13115 [Deltaproteobacteria bacterium]